ncbi:MAG: hypothetical protein DI556_19295 [Rhodovulum sulfidophilum]|uniref:Recombination endonuclease VII n=1 Tax=Rhodovulum sulfidophilum TaxID=35806 RepID=A0A2W5N2B3_RHOSU|nr:MAG: hypothetical protein DI556_19295 [Rhodovulum sulfidophilum]
MESKVCKQCGVEKKLTSFHLASGNKDNRNTCCSVCINSNRRLKYKGRRYDRRKHLKSKYNITIEDFDKMLISQSEKCAICDKKLTTDYNHRKNGNLAVVDHCHSVGTIRGILCNSCNTGLGYFSDNIHFLNKAIMYLKNSK